MAWLLLRAYRIVCSQRDGLKLELMFKREAEHKSLENLQLDNVIEKKIPFSEEKYKLAAEICISNKEPNVNHQDNRENVSRACQGSLQHHLLVRRLRREKVTSWTGPRALLLCAALQLGALCPSHSSFSHG